jgi:hypothetical protein
VEIATATLYLSAGLIQECTHRGAFLFPPNGRS